MNSIDSSIKEASQGWAKIPSYRSAFAFIHVPEKDSVVLDLGCGIGGHLYMWEKEGNRIVGADVDPEAIKIATQNNPKYDYILMNGSNIPFDESSVDVVIMLDAIEHVESEKDAFAEIWRVLKPDGILVLTTPYRNMFGDWMDGDNLFFIPLSRWKNWLMRRPFEAPRHRHYTTDDLLKFCPNMFELKTEEITGGMETAFLTFFGKFIGKISRNRVGLIRKLQARLRIISQNSHFRRRKKATASKLNIILRAIK